MRGGEMDSTEQGQAAVPKEKKTYSFFPDHVAMEVILGFFLLGLISVFTILFYPELGPKANPQVTPEHIKPEWYFFPIFRFIKLTPEWLGLLGQAVGAMLFIFWPFVDSFLVKKTGNRLISPVFGVCVMFLLITFMIWEAYV